MSDNVIPMFGQVYHDEPAESVLEKAKSWDLECCMVLGQNSNGEFIIGGSTSEMKDMLWILQRALWWMGRQEGELGQ